MSILGYFMAIGIGTLLGLIGGGGSILTVPLLAYIFNYDERIATAYSLFLVGVAALMSGLIQRKHVQWKIAIVFGIPSLLGVWLVRHFVIPSLPDILFYFGDQAFTRRMLMFGLFSLLMFLAAYFMISDKETKPQKNKIVKFKSSIIIIEGIVVGGITGLVGAGGGFLIVPALALISKLELKDAIATSLIIIAFKSILGFLLGDAMALEIDWAFLISILSLIIIGIFIGQYLYRFMNTGILKKTFAYFIISVGVFIFFMEFIIKNAIA